MYDWQITVWYVSWTPPQGALHLACCTPEKTLYVRGLHIRSHQLRFIHMALTLLYPVAVQDQGLNQWNVSC
jgi:hypothetical protein